MTHENRTLTAPLFLVALMLLAPFAGAANVTTFANSDTESDIEMRGGSPFSNLADGSIDLPATDTVTSASVDLSVHMMEHASHQRAESSSHCRLYSFTVVSLRESFKFGARPLLSITLTALLVSCVRA